LTLGGDLGYNIFTVLERATEIAMEFVQVGWFVVGGEDAKFGAKEYGERFEPMDGDLKYWEARGYELVPVFVKA
jgi:hypothetical protein